MDLKELKELWKGNDFRSNKKLGQNFLIDGNVRDKILKALPLTEDSSVLEIGAGFGVMSFEIASKCRKLFAIEKDPRVCRIIEPLFKEKENITLIEADALEVDICGLAGRNEKITVFGNVPYYISTPLIEKLIDQRKCIKDIFIVIQEELAERISSPPGSKVYGSISCFVQFYTRVKKLFKIKKNSFFPRPKVESSLLHLEVLSHPSVRVKDELLMFKIIRKAFSERRKKIVNSLSRGDFLSMEKDQWQRTLEKCSIDPSSRAENLSLKDYANLADQVKKTAKAI